MIFDSIIEWNKKRNNVEFIPESEYNMLKEELDEFDEATVPYYYDADGYEVPRTEEEMEQLQVDALCDLIVVATGAIHKLGYSPTLSMLETLQEINSRQQDPMQATLWSMEGPSGKWKKWVDQPKDTLYKANYSKCLYQEDTDIRKAQLEEMREDIK